jgi:hypothetical protein
MLVEHYAALLFTAMKGTAPGMETTQTCGLAPLLIAVHIPRANMHSVIKYSVRGF